MRLSLYIWRVSSKPAQQPTNHHEPKFSKSICVLYWQANQLYHQSDPMLWDSLSISGGCLQNQPNSPPTTMNQNSQRAYVFYVGSLWDLWGLLHVGIYRDCHCLRNLGWLRLWLFHCLLNYIGAEESLAESNEQLGKKKGISKSKSIQPRSARWLNCIGKWRGNPKIFRITRFPFEDTLQI